MEYNGIVKEILAFSKLHFPTWVLAIKSTDHSKSHDDWQSKAEVLLFNPIRPEFPKNTSGADHIQTMATIDRGTHTKHSLDKGARLSKLSLDILVNTFTQCFHRLRKGTTGLLRCCGLVQKHSLRNWTGKNANFSSAKIILRKKFQSRSNTPTPAVELAGKGSNISTSHLSTSCTGRIYAVYSHFDPPFHRGSN